MTFCHLTFFAVGSLLGSLVPRVRPSVAGLPVHGPHENVRVADFIFCGDWEVLSFVALGLVDSLCLRFVTGERTVPRYIV